MAEFEFEQYENVPDTPAVTVPDVSDADLDSILGGDKTLDQIVVKDDEADETTDEVEAAPEQEAAETTDDPGETEAEAVEAEAETTDEPEFDEGQAAIEIERARADKAEAQMERQRFLADRNAGLLGHIQKELAQLKSRPPTAAAQDFEQPERPFDAPGQPQPAPAPFQEEIQEMRSERVARALQEVGQQWNEDNREFLEGINKVHGEETHKTFMADLTERIGQMGKEIDISLFADDPKMSAVTAKAMLKSAMADAKIHFLQQRSEAARKQKSEQSDELKAAKRSAKVTGSKGGKPAPAKPKTVDEMTEDQLDAFTDRSLKEAGIL